MSLFSTLPKLKRHLGVLLFPNFELLDVFGPLSMLEHLPGLKISLVSETTGRIAASGGPESWTTEDFQSTARYDWIMVPGGLGTRQEVHNPALLNWIKTHSAQADYCLAVCTGSALLAAAGVLDNKRATSNKAAFEWASAQGQHTEWVHQARWVEDGKIFTSSGVSAGMDMALGFITHLYDEKTAEQIAQKAEYTWHRDKDRDPFAALYPLARSQ